LLSSTDSVEGRVLAALSGEEDDDDDEHDEDAKSLCIKDWDATNVPRDRVFLFPGAVPSSGEDRSKVIFTEVAHCDGCQNRIRGTIQKCIDCFDYGTY
jgi:hypothetical protein